MICNNLGGDLETFYSYDSMVKIGREKLFTIMFKIISNEEREIGRIGM